MFLFTNAIFSLLVITELMDIGYNRIRDLNEYDGNRAFHRPNDVAAHVSEFLKKNLRLKEKIEQCQHNPMLDLGN